jgi:hypothetical protein
VYADAVRVEPEAGGQLFGARRPAKLAEQRMQTGATRLRQDIVVRGARRGHAASFSQPAWEIEGRRDILSNQAGKKAKEPMNGGALAA